MARLGASAYLYRRQPFQKAIRDKCRCRWYRWGYATRFPEFGGAFDVVTLAVGGGLGSGKVFLGTLLL